MNKTIRITELITVCLVLVITFAVMFVILYEGKKLLLSDGPNAGPIVKVEIDSTKTNTWDYTIADTSIVEVKNVEETAQKQNSETENGEVVETSEQNITVRYSIMPLKEGKTTVTFRMLPLEEGGPIETKTYNILVSKVGLNALSANIIE